MQTLPPPNADALAHSAHLREIIQEQIIAAGGSLPFWKFMELALYAPGLGYYSAGAIKFGRGGDFVTAPELSPLFAACVADALTPVLQQLGPEAQFMEIGGGSGAFAETALAKLLANDALPARYAILEPSADLRERQRERLQARLPPLLFELVEWLDGPIQDAWNGVLFANEVIDALPTPRFTIRDGEVFEEHVALDGEGRFLRTDRPADPMLAAAVRHVERQLPEPFAEGYRSELLAQLPYWLQAVAGGMGDVEHRQAAIRRVDSEEQGAVGGDGEGVGLASFKVLVRHGGAGGSWNGQGGEATDGEVPMRLISPMPEEADDSLEEGHVVIG